jgi:uncharacterized membrane protein
MTPTAHLWAIGYDDTERAEEVRAQIVRLGEGHCLTLLDTAVVVRYRDGSVTLNGELFVAPPKFRGHTLVSLLAGLSLGAPPLTGAAAGAWVRAAGGTAAAVGIDEGFVSEVNALLKPGTSALFVLDQERDLATILDGIRGLGGTVLKANVDPTRATLIQSTLAGAADECMPDGS